MKTRFFDVVVGVPTTSSEIAHAIFDIYFGGPTNSSTHRRMVHKSDTPTYRKYGPFVEYFDELDESKNTFHFEDWNMVAK